MKQPYTRSNLNAYSWTSEVWSKWSYQTIRYRFTFSIVFIANYALLNEFENLE